MFMTLTGQLSWQRLRRSAVDFYSKKRKNRSLSHPLGHVRTPSMARWKASSRLYIRRNWTFFAISYGWDVMSGNRPKSAFFEGGGSLWAQISEGRGRRPPTTVGTKVAEWLPFRVVSVRHLVLSQCTRVTDRQTDRITTPKTALSYARTVKRNCFFRFICLSVSELDMGLVCLWAISGQVGSQNSLTCMGRVASSPLLKKYH